MNKKESEQVLEAINFYYRKHFASIDEVGVDRLVHYIAVGLHERKIRMAEHESLTEKYEKIIDIVRDDAQYDD